MQFTYQKDTDPDGSRLRSLLETHLIYERMCAARSFSVHLLAIAGAPMWLDAAWPTLFPAEFKFFFLVLWIGLLFIALWAAAQEYVSCRKLRRYPEVNQVGARKSFSQRPI